MLHCGFMVDTQQLRMESSLEMSAVTGGISDVRSINTSSTTPTPATISTVYPSVDPCYNYTVLDEPWRANSSQSSSSYKSDRDLTWSGWYRLFINGLSAQIPDTCVEIYSCGTRIPLWIPDAHPRFEDGVVTRDVCGHWDSYFCYYRS
ncbi:pancreatic secretory granule membrane major glycoprotein GP2-like [Labeo rohita]|uniref:pancreatic secretory granule membrane major glycoprotein GP2-like n=1 Tax=Labeo rohita TaxID=84645 RepID=UPI0021E1F55C|nr:pancreatic secretory granule membrane major glycoprotein GP2-like [Labeo rohita]